MNKPSIYTKFVSFWGSLTALGFPSRFDFTPKGSELTCDSTTGSISGDCRDLYNAVEVSVCYEVQNPKMCIDPKQVSGTLNIYAKFHLKAEGTSVQSSPTVAVDMSQYYDCSGGDEVSILSSMAAGAARVGGSLVLMLLYFVGSG